MSDPNERIMMNFRIPRKLRDKFAAVAAGHGRSASSFVREIMETVTSIDAGFWNALMELAAKHQLAIEQCRLEERRRDVQQG